MPNDTTKNGVDISTIDVSQLALVDKKNLLEDLSSKIKETIEDTFEVSINNLNKSVQAGGRAVSGDDAPDWDSMGSLNKRSSGPSGPPNNPPRSPRTPRGPFIPNGGNGLSEQEIKKQQDEFEKLRKLKDRTEKQMERALAVQRKQQKLQREQDMRGKVYSQKGLSYAGTIDDTVDEIHKADIKELEKLKDQVALLRKNIELDTRGDEQALLTKHADQLQQALMEESKLRKTTFGRISHSFDKNAENVVSIVAGLTAHSPLAGLATKYVLSKIREQKEESEEQKNKKLRVSRKLTDTLSRKPEPVTEENRLDPSEFEKQLQGTDDPDQRYELLKSAHKQNRITDQQHQDLSKLIPPHYMPLNERVDRDRKLRNGIPYTPPQAQPATQSDIPNSTTIADQSSTKPQPVSSIQVGPHKIGIPDWWQDQAKKPKHEQLKDEQAAWMKLAGVRQQQKQQAEYEHSLSNPLTPDNPNYSFFSDPNIIGSEAFAPPKPRRMFGEQVVAPLANNIQSEPKERLEEPQKVAPVVHSEQPTKVPDFDKAQESKEEKTNTDLYQTIKGQSKEVHGLHVDLSKLEKLNEQQLEELRLINKYLKQQIEQGELASEAAQRQTKHEGTGVPGTGEGGGGETGGKKKTEGGGLLSTFAKDYLEIKTGEKGLSLAKGLTKSIGRKVGLDKLPGVGKWFKKAVPVTEEAATGASKVAPVLEEGASAASSAAKAVDVGAEAGGVSKLIGKSAGIFAEGGMLSKLPLIGKLTPALEGLSKVATKAGPALVLVQGAIDGIQGANDDNASRITGIDTKDLTTADRVSAGGIHAAVQAFPNVAKAGAFVGNVATLGVQNYLSKKITGMSPDELIDKVTHPVEEALGRGNEKLYKMTHGIGPEAEASGKRSDELKERMKKFMSQGMSKDQASKAAITQMQSEMQDAKRYPQNKDDTKSSQRQQQSQPYNPPPAPSSSSSTTESTKKITSDSSDPKNTPRLASKINPYNPYEEKTTPNKQSGDSISSFGVGVKNDGSSGVNTKGLGSFVGQNESGNNPGAIGGTDQEDGRAYGAFQIATKPGTFAKFMDYLKTSYPEYYKILQNAGGLEAAKKSDPKFIAAFQGLAKSDRAGFYDAQRKFTVQEHYDPTIKALQAKGIDLSDRPLSVQQVILHAGNALGAGGATKLITNLKKNYGDLSKMDNKTLVSNIYKEIETEIPKLYPRAALQPVMAGYYKKASRTALAMVDQENNSQVASNAPTRQDKAVSAKPAPISTIATNLVPTSPTSGVAIAKESTTNSAMKLAMMDKPQAGPNIIAPQSSVVNNNTTQTVDLKAKNTNNTYQRNMDLMYSST